MYRDILDFVFAACDGKIQNSEEILLVEKGSITEYYFPNSRVSVLDLWNKNVSFHNVHKSSFVDDTVVTVSIGAKNVVEFYNPLNVYPIFSVQDVDDFDAVLIQYSTICSSNIMAVLMTIGAYVVNYIQYKNLPITSFSLSHFHAVNEIENIKKILETVRNP